jgi:hypothetical protein
MIIQDMIKIYYWVEPQFWCKEYSLSHYTEKYGSDYHITHVYKTDSIDSIDELIHKLIF